MEYLDNNYDTADEKEIDKYSKEEEKAMLEQLSTHENFVPKPGKNDKSVFNRVRQFFQ